ncbi:MAG: hypothetical protein ACRDDM_08250 [Paraclostridium sp.]
MDKRFEEFCEIENINKKEMTKKQEKIIKSSLTFNLYVLKKEIKYIFKTIIRL